VRFLARGRFPAAFTSSLELARGLPGRHEIDGSTIGPALRRLPIVV